MTASLVKRYNRGWQFQANYTLSRAEDDTSDFSSLSVPFRPDQLKKDWSISDFNVTHNFVGNAVYTTPFKRVGTGWSRAFADVSDSPVVNARSGIPITVLVRVWAALAGTEPSGIRAKPAPGTKIAIRGVAMPLRARMSEYPSRFTLNGGE